MCSHVSLQALTQSEPFITYITLIVIKGFIGMNIYKHTLEHIQVINLINVMYVIKGFIGMTLCNNTWEHIINHIYKVYHRYVFSCVRVGFHSVWTFYQMHHIYNVYHLYAFALVFLENISLKKWDKTLSDCRIFLQKYSEFHWGDCNCIILNTHSSLLSCSLLIHALYTYSMIEPSY
jgi:hypothetical protein